MPQRQPPAPPPHLLPRAAWERGNGVTDIHAPAIDQVLHRERLDGRSKRRHELPMPIARLPDGAMVALGDESYLIAKGRAHLWSPARKASSLPPLTQT